MYCKVILNKQCVCRFPVSSPSLLMCEQRPLATTQSSAYRETFRHFKVTWKRHHEPLLLSVSTLAFAWLLLLCFFKCCQEWCVYICFSVLEILQIVILILLSTTLRSWGRCDASDRNLSLTSSTERRETTAVLRWGRLEPVGGSNGTLGFKLQPRVHLVHSASGAGRGVVCVFGGEKPQAAWTKWGEKIWSLSQMVSGGRSRSSDQKHSIMSATFANIQPRLLVNAKERKKER